MDSIVFWISLGVRVLLILVLLRVLVWLFFWLVERVWGLRVSGSGWRLCGLESLTIKSSRLEVEINNVYLTVRWLDPTCRHFFKVNVGGVHLECALYPPEEGREKGGRQKKKARPGPSRKRRFLYWCICKIVKLVEVSVGCLEMWVHDVVQSEVSLVTLLQVMGRLDIIAQPLPDKVLAVTVNIEEATGQLLLHSEKSYPHDDVLQPLVELSFSSKVFLFLSPLRTSRGTLDSIQINTVPIALSLLEEGAIEHALQHLKSFLPRPSKDAGSDSSTEKQSKDWSKLPEKLEIVLEDIAVHYHANKANRVLSSKLTRVSMATTLTHPIEAEEKALPTFSVTAGLHGLQVSDSLSREFVKLHQLRLLSQSSSGSLSNSVQVESVHCCLWEREAVFWGRYLTDRISSYRTTHKSNEKSDKDEKKKTNEDRAKVIVSKALTFPVSVVTTVEASDWSVLLRMETPRYSLQSKEPLCRVVMASGVANVQWSPPENESTTVRASLRLEDSYLQVPGFHPSTNDPSSFHQRVDNPRILPSLQKHLWGRVLSLGSLTLRAEKDVHIRTDPAGTRELEIEFLQDPLRISGEGGSLMLEWSKPSVVSLMRTLRHLKRVYKLFGAGSATQGSRIKSGDAKQPTTFQTQPKKEGAPDGQASGSAVDLCPSLSVDIKFQLTDVNAFIYSLTPDPPAVMLRLDAASLSTNSPPSLQVDLHGVLVDNLSLLSPGPTFLCSPIASLPQGVGIATTSTLTVKYEHNRKSLGLTVAKMTADWTSTAHRSLFHVTSCLWKDIREVMGVLKPEALSTSPPTPSPTTGGVVSLGEEGRSVLGKMPLSVVVALETAECVAWVGRGAKVSLSLQTGHCTVSEGTLSADVYEVGVSFDGHRVFTLEGLVGKFPHSSEDLLVKRRASSKIEVQENPAVGLSAIRAEFVFPYKYNFSATFDKVMNIKRFLQTLHSSRKGESPEQLLLPPDVVLECEDILFQICDDPFEIKLRANYELMCDEAEQKSQRMEELKRKLVEFRREKGEILSAKKVQSLYDSLEEKDSEIFCRRSREMHASSDSQQAGLFLYSMQQSRLHAMFDPSMLGRERLVNHLRDIDSVSPFPEGKYGFSTLWGAYVAGETQKFQLQLRDYPHPLLVGTEVGASGRIVFAEHEAQEREKRSAVVEVGRPWSNVVVERKLPPLKYYYDLEMTADAVEWSYGPSLEPALSETNLGFELLTSRTIDPSKPLSYWDKFRLLFHGHLHLATRVMAITLPASTNPYNNVEFLKLLLGDLDFKLLTNNKVDLEGSLQLFVHTASKYDECEILNIPHVKSSLTLLYNCGGRDPNNHHSVVRCTPDKIPVQPEKQEHDSYGAFRSQYMDIQWTFDAQPQKPEHPNPPTVLLFSSALRWLQKYQVLNSRNVTRPIRKGKHFKNCKPRRTSLMRHWREVSISASFPKSVLLYWSSVAQQRGVECTIDKGVFSMHYKLKLIPFEGELKRRERANWTISSCHGALNNLTVHVNRSTVITEELDDLFVIENRSREEEDVGGETMGEKKRCILLSMTELTYDRHESDFQSPRSEEFTHLIRTQNTRMLWNASNKEVVLGLFDAYQRAQKLKRDLSAEAVKSILTKLDTPAKEAVGSDTGKGGGEEDDNGDGGEGEDLSPRRLHPRLRHHSSSGCVMLDQLLQDISNKFVTYAEERAPSDPILKGIHASNWKDTTKKNWFIELVNTQLALEGIEHKGFVVASSYVAQVFGCEHEPRLREGDLVNKKSWIFKVQDVQYFVTVGTGPDPKYIPWLPLSVICSPSVGVHDPNFEATPHDEESSLNALLSELGPDQESKRDRRGEAPPGEAVGGLVSCLLIPRDSDPGGEELSKAARKTEQLQRIASRCHCQVFYVTYGGEVETDDGRTPPLLSPSCQTSPGLYDSSNEAVDTFTFRYPAVELCTTSSQYALIMDTVNNLLLHKEPKKKEALDRHAQMQFTLQLSNIQDPRKSVLVQQNKVRKCLETIRNLETQLFLQQKSVADSDGGESWEELEVQLSAAKEENSTASMKLRAMIRAFKESQLYMTPPDTESSPEPVRRIEIWVDDAHWWLTHEDGQLQVADIRFTNFSYTRVSFSDDSGDHRLELGTFRVNNLMPNTPPIYQQVLIPYDPKSRRLRVDKNICLRVYCRDKAPVAGIPVTEHLELNVVPLAVSLTARFYQTMQDFFFPKAELEAVESTDADHTNLFGPGTGVQSTPSNGDMPDGNSLPRGSSISRRSTMSVASSATATTTSAGYSPPGSPNPKELRKGKRHGGMQLDDVEKMKERASHIKTFIYVKITQITLCITYKSENVSYKDLQNVLVTIPTREYHNRNWTWTDMLMEVKKDYKDAIIRQTLKSAIGMKESDEAAGLASPKLTRNPDLLMGKSKSSKAAGKGRKLFGKLGTSRDDSDEERVTEGVHYQPPLTDPDINLKRTYKKLSKLSQEVQK